MKKRVLSLLVMAIAIHADANTLRGPSDMTCGTYIAQKDELLRGAALLWSLGYLSGINAFSTKVDFLAHTDAAAIEQALLLYCRNNPLATLLNATESVANQLLSRAQK